jgi:hypothetical protein
VAGEEDVEMNRWLLLLAAAALASGQTVERTFPFTNAASPQDMQEIATAIRSVADIPQISVDEGRKTMTATGSPDQVALADWLFPRFDVLPGQANPAEYRMPGGPESDVRVFYLNNTASVAEFQEMAVLLRTISQSRRLFTYNGARVVAVRGTPNQVDLADWLQTQLGQLPAKSPTPEYRVGGNADDAVRLFYLNQPKTIQSFQEIATLTRSLGDIRILFTYNPAKVIALRGSAAQIAMADWVLHELDQPAHSQPMAWYRMAGSSEDAVRIFYLSPKLSAPDFQKMASAVRIATKIRRAFTYNEPRAMAVRGTDDQIAEAERLVAALP